MSRYEQQFFEYFDNIKRQLMSRPLVLGGVSGSGGGTGGPPGGFYGYLPQRRVAYDTTESATAYTPTASASLVDNLNHIRYRLGLLESNPGIDVYEDSVLVQEGITILNVEAGLNVTDNGGNQVTLSVSGISHSTLADLNSDDHAQYSLVDGTRAFTGTVAGIYPTLDSHIATKEYVDATVSGITISGGGVSLEIQEDDVQVATDISILNFEGSADVVDNGGGKATITITASGTGGSDNFLDLTDTPATYSGQASKLVAVNSLATALEFINASGVALNWNHTVIVDGAGGGDYTSVKDACDYVETQLDADITNQWVILVMPGVYEEIPFTVPEQTAITSFNGSISSTGDGFKTPMITLPTGDFSGTWITMNAKSKLENVELGNPGTSNSATDDVIVIELAGSYVSIKGCVIDVGFTGTARTITTIDPQGYNLRIDGSEIWADVSAGNTSYCLFDDDWGVSELYNCNLIGGTHSVHIESFTEVYLFGCNVVEELYTDAFATIYTAGTYFRTSTGNINEVDNSKFKISAGDGHPGYFTTKVEAGNGISFVTDVAGDNYVLTIHASGVGGASNFLDLDDTPDDYTSFSGWLTRVNDTETALEFIDPATVVSGLSNPIVRNIAFTILGNLNVGIGAVELENRFGVTLTLEGLYLRCKTAPDGDDIIADLNIDGSTVFTDPDNRPSILDGNTTGNTTTFDTSTWADGEALSIDIDNIGSSIAGANLTAVLKCTQ